MTENEIVFDFGDFQTETEKKVENKETTQETTETASTEEVDTTEVSTETSTEETQTTDVDDDNPLVTTFNHFKEIKVLPEGVEFDGTEEGFVNTIKETYKNQVIDEIRTSLPEEGLALLDYMLEGGNDIAAFKETFTNDWEKFTFSEENREEQNKQVLKAYYLSKGFSEAKANKEVEAKVTFASDTESADEALVELKELSAKTKKDFVENQKAAQKAQTEAIQKEFNDFSEVLKNTAEIDTFKLSDKDKKDILGLYYGTVKTEQGNVPALNYVLSQKLADKNEAIKLAAWLLKGSNTEGVKAAAKTEANKNLKDKLKKHSDGATKLKPGAQTQRTASGPIDLNHVSIG
jgi:hypothetical protein